MWFLFRYWLSLLTNSLSASLSKYCINYSFEATPPILFSSLFFSFMFWQILSMFEFSQSSIFYRTSCLKPLHFKTFCLIAKVDLNSKPNSRFSLTSYARQYFKWILFSSSLSLDIFKYLLFWSSRIDFK